MIYDDEPTERDMYMYHRGEMREYIRNHGILPGDVHHSLYIWVESGHSVRDNPWGIRSPETGLPADYLKAMDVLEEKAAWFAKMKALLK